MGVDFDRHNAPFLRVFGETVAFWPDEFNETEVTAIVYRSARSENRSPGNVTSVFFRLSDLSDLPAKGDLVQIGEDRFQLGDPDVSNDGTATVIVRKVSQSS